jgi:hypothetical protein
MTQMSREDLLAGSRTSGVAELVAPFFEAIGVMA